ncbi:hypothetical protein [Crateriforma conspicua]|uniref:hypothetical protein n=1 Tax=Crateriforma conspicua TaxID=2527996 RepID=UPI00118C9426|nr:hypothetical protein [Crateriforma conspicua]QDV66259.1 hypothetical protein Mal65_54350 [Crateriforma conspicua]
MSVFKDEQNQEWHLKATVTAFERIRDEADIDMLSLIDDRAVLERITNHPPTFVAVLHAWLMPQLNQRGVTPEAFAELLYGPTMQYAMEAAMKEVPQFFPLHRQPIVMAMIGKYLAAERKAADNAIEKLNDPQTDAMVDQVIARANRQADQEMQRIIGETCTRSPESLESTPGL